MNVTGSVHYYTLSPVYMLLFLVLVGFIYHLIRNNEYKDTLLASIIIGFIFSLLVNPATNLPSFLKWTLIIIILVISGGLLAVGLKKLLKKD